jgi:hypothetical protein
MALDAMVAQYRVQGIADIFGTLDESGNPGCEGGKVVSAQLKDQDGRRRNLE